MSKDATATLACQKPGKRRNPECNCVPCACRREIFGQAIVGIPEQEARRCALSKGLIASLKEPAPENLHDPLPR